MQCRTGSRTLVCLVSAALSVVALGCGEPPEEAAPAALEVDRDALENALLNERELGEAGYIVEGRAWHRRDAYTTIFKDGNGARFGLVSMRAGVDVGAVDPSPAEAFADYVKRVGGVQRPLAGVSSAGRNVLLFPPAPPGGPVTTVTQAVVGNERCPRTFFDALCSQWAGYFGSQIASTWSVTDITSTNTKSGNAVGVNAIVCADRGSSNLTVTNANPRWLGAPPDFDITINEGFVGHYVGGGQWWEQEYCASWFLGICVDYQFRIFFQTFDSTVKAVPHAGSEAHFCGKMSWHADYNEGDFYCGELATCPLWCDPGSTNSACKR